nr:hypothetical protein [uncultured Alloprevotella sp.]
MKKKKRHEHTVRPVTPIDKEAEKWPRGELQQQICPIAPNKKQKKSSRSRMIDDSWSISNQKMGPCANILMALENTIKMSADRIRLSANALIAFFLYA